MSRRVLHTCLLALAALLIAGLNTAYAQTGSYTPTAQNGGTAYLAPSGKAKIANGIAIPPADAPPQVVAMINAANAISTKPYRYGGGHAKFEDSAYDCSGSESYALHGANLIDRPMDSSEFMSWGEPGEGTWITSYANSGHSFLVVAGLRFDTGYNNSTSSGPKWSDQMRPTGSYTARHPEGL